MPADGEIAPVWVQMSQLSILWMVTSTLLPPIYHHFHVISLYIVGQSIAIYRLDREQKVERKVQNYSMKALNLVRVVLL